MSKDDRSDIESSSDEDDSPPPNQKHHSSTTTNGTNKNHGTNGYLTGAPYPDEHWLSQYHDTGAMLQTQYINVCACACAVETWTTLPVRYWKFLIDLCECSFVISLSYLTNFLTRFHLFIYTFASNCTWNIEALLSVQPILSLDNEWKHSTLWCKHATLTYSSLAYWGCDFSYVFVFVCYLFFINFCRW